MASRTFKWLLSGGVVFSILIALLITADSFRKPMFVHPLLTSQTMGTHYFVNDVVGISPRNEQQPNAYVLSHSSRAAVFVSDQDGKTMRTAADSFGLSQDPVYPGWGASTKRIYSTALLQLEYLHTMVVGTVNLENDLDTYRFVEITVPWPAAGAAFGNVEMVRTQKAQGTAFAVVIKGSGSFWIETYPPPSDGFPIEFGLDGFQPGEVVVGADQVEMPSEYFKLATRDFHSFARTELDGDGEREFSVVRGGIRGRIDMVSPDAKDLLIDTATNADIAKDYPEFKKYGCPGRQSAWVDIDSDNDLDLYVVCGRSNEPNKQFSNQLFVHEGTRFRENAAKFAIDFADYGTFRFIDWDQDLDPDLVWASNNGDLLYYENDHGEFREKYRTSGTWGSSNRSVQLLVYDLEKDGDPDILVVHPAGNVVLINNNTEPELKNASQYGLPDKALVAHWADINLDGEIDLLTATHGIYLGSGDSMFRQEVGTLTGAHFVYDARLVSFEGSDGREFMLAYRSCLPGKLCGARRVLLSTLRRFVHLPYDWYEAMKLFEPYDWSVQTARRNSDMNEVNREVAVSIQGGKLNPDSIGARMDVSLASVKQSHWVGETDSAFYSRGDFNMYLTVPAAATPTVTVFWQDGCVSSFLIPLKVRHVEIPRPESCTL